MTIDFRKLDRTALALQPFVDGLLTGNRTREDVPLLDLPIRWTEFGRHWEQVFEQAGGMLPRILETGAALVDQLWESRGPWCSARSYAAIEAWLRRHTLPLGAYRPRLTLKPLLFVTAVHNWWWWQRTGEQVARLYARARPAAESAEDRRERERALRRTLAGLDVANPQLLVGPTLEQQLKRDVAISVTNFFAAAEMVAVTDYCATLPSLICRQLMHDPRLKVLPAPFDLGSFPVEMAWHVRYRHDPAHRWLRALIGEVITDFKDKTAATAMTSPT